MARRRTWLVEYVPEAVKEFEAITDSSERLAALNVVHKLVALGPALPEPHAKALQDHPRLMKLRPRQGRSQIRPIYVRRYDSFLILAVSRRQDDFETAVANANARAAEYDPT